MSNNVTYNQIIYISNGSIISKTVNGTGVIEGRLILVTDDSSRIIIDGKNIHSIGYEERKQQLIIKAQEKGFDIRVNSIIHYANEKEGNSKKEYVLIRW